MTIPPKKLSFIDDQSLLIYDSSSVQIRVKLSGKYFLAANWNLTDFNLKSEDSQIKFVLATGSIVIILIVGSSKRFGCQIVCLNRNDGLVRSYPLPPFDEVLDGNLSHLENKLLVKIITDKATLIKVPLAEISYDLAGPIEETVVMNSSDRADTLVLAKIFDISPNDNFVLVNLMKSSSCISQITSLSSQTHILDRLSSILYLTRAINSIFLAAQEPTGSVVLYKFNLESFELSGSFHLFDAVDSQSFIHLHLILPAKLLIFCIRDDSITIQLVELNSMNLLELCTEKLNFFSSEVADMRVSKGLNVQFLLTNGSVINYAGLASRNTWNNAGGLFADKFEFNQWFNLLDEFVPLCDIPTGVPFLKDMTKNISSWTEMRSTVDHIISDANMLTSSKLCSIGFLIGSRGTGYTQFCKLFSVYAFDKIQVDFAIALKSLKSIARYLQIIPLNWYTQIKTDLTRTQLDELANYFINTNITMHLDLIVGSDIEPMIILDFACRNHLLDDLVNSLPFPSILNYPFTQKEFVQVFQSLSDYRGKFLLLKTRYFYADMYQLFANNRSLLTSEEPTINNLKKAIPDIAALPTRFYNKLSRYPTLPRFDISSSPQPQIVPIESPSPLKERTALGRRVSFAPSPRLEIKSPPLHEPKQDEIRLAFGGLERKLATPRHHATILPSRLSSQIKPAKEIEEVSGEEGRESLEEIESPSKKRGRMTVREGTKAKKPSPSPPKPKFTPPSPPKKGLVVSEEEEEVARQLGEKRSTSLSPYKKVATPSRNKSLSPARRVESPKSFEKRKLLEGETLPKPTFAEEESIHKVSPPRQSKRRQAGERADTSETEYFIAKDVHNSPRLHILPDTYSPTRSGSATPSRKRLRGNKTDASPGPRRKLNFEDGDVATDIPQQLEEEQELPSSPPKNISIRRKKKPMVKISTPKKQMVEDQSGKAFPKVGIKAADRLQ